MKLVAIGVGLILNLVALVGSLVLTYNMMGLVQAPNWMYCVFWVYVPCFLLGSALSKAASSE